MTSVLVLILSVIVLSAIGGVVCVYWTARGDAARWARGVAVATEVTSELLLKASRNSTGRKHGSA
ncbi:hypothetical protein P1P68_40205 [Streptomyces scabiei]|uniref:hypothetical protein n=1 Tax=Streptomyces scabiei TaxID=1930 RepID=UPI0029906EB8|nr:hypothetical protein [Streptomyces scabiei]MDW8810862.1 hypothetical protein [Streptomyces scabiei]